MGKFLKGLFVGVGVGLFIAPQTGKETRRMIVERATALRRSMLPEADEHFAIDARSSQITTYPVESDQAVAVFSSEPPEQVTPSVPPDQPIAASLSEPREQVTTIAPTEPIVAPLREPLEEITAGVPPAEPITTSSSEPLEQVTTSIAPTESAVAPLRESLEEVTAGVPPAEPITMSSSELHEQGTISATPADSKSMFSHPNANTSESTHNIADTTQTSGATTNPHFVAEANPDQQPPTETPKTDAEKTDKLPTLSSPPNRPGQTAKRKASARTSSTSKSRGHSRS
jgi:hypothetical protein